MESVMAGMGAAIGLLIVIAWLQMRRADDAERSLKHSRVEFLAERQRAASLSYTAGMLAEDAEELRTEVEHQRTRIGALDKALAECVDDRDVARRLANQAHREALAWKTDYDAEQKNGVEWDRRVKELQGKLETAEWQLHESGLKLAAAYDTIEEHKRHDADAARWLKDSKDEAERLQSRMRTALHVLKEEAADYPTL